MELYDKIHENEELKTYILAGNRVLGELGFTEHGLAHAGTVSKMSREILEILNYSDHECELAAVAGYMHDIGNMINRCDHAQSGGILAFNILRSLDVSPKDIALIVGAIGHHDEKTAAPVSPIAAALILADKSDVRRSRVRNSKTVSTDIHDRVNYAVVDSELEVDGEDRVIILRLKIDTDGDGILRDFPRTHGALQKICRQTRLQLRADNQRHEIAVSVRTICRTLQVENQ